MLKYCGKQDAIAYFTKDEANMRRTTTLVCKGFQFNKDAKNYHLARNSRLIRNDRLIL